MYYTQFEFLEDLQYSTREMNWLTKIIVMVNAEHKNASPKSSTTGGVHSLRYAKWQSGAGKIGEIVVGDIKTKIKTSKQPDVQKKTGNRVCHDYLS